MNSCNFFRLIHGGFQNLRLLSNHNQAGIRKQKYIGTRKHNSEAVGEAKHEHVTKDSDGSTRDVFPENVRGITPQATDGDNRSVEQCDAGGKQRGNKHEVLDPPSYRDALVNGQTTTRW